MHYILTWTMQHSRPSIRLKARNIRKCQTLQSQKKRFCTKFFNNVWVCSLLSKMNLNLFSYFSSFFQKLNLRIHVFFPVFRYVSKKNQGPLVCNTTVCTAIYCYVSTLCTCIKCFQNAVRLKIHSFIFGGHVCRISRLDMCAFFFRLGSTPYFTGIEISC